MESLSTAKFNPKPFAALQMLIVIVIFSFIRAFQATTLVTSLDAFTLGSIAMAVTIALYPRSHEPYFHNSLALSTWSCLVFFLSGSLQETILVVGNSPLFDIPGVMIITSWVVDFNSALFLLGVLDLLLLSVFFLRFTIVKEQMISYIC